jgi:hypothetical protein
MILSSLFLFCRSKAMLFAFLKSPKTSAVLEHSEVNRILTFLRSNVFPHEHLFARCFFLGIRAFDAWSNTPHEGTNSALKYCENRVRPNMSQAESTKVMTDQDAARAKKKAVAVSDAFHKTQLYSDTPSSQQIQKVAESMLQQELESAESYVSIRIDEKTFWVLRAVTRKVGKSPVPVFERVRVVTIGEDRCLRCSCEYPGHYGIPDRHISHVALHYGVDFQCWSHHDVDLRYHNSYCRLVAMKDPDSMNEDEKVIRANLISCRVQDLPVPLAPRICANDGSCNFAVGDNCDDEELRSYDSVNTRIRKVQEKSVTVLNYTDSEVSSAIRGLNDGADNAAGFTQESHKCDDGEWPGADNDDDDDDDDGGVLGGAIDFSWDPSGTPEGKTPSTAYAEGAPLCKEILQELDGSSPSTREHGLKLLHDVTLQIKARRASSLGGGPKGGIVSGKVKSKNASSTHKKQEYCPR